MARGQGGFTLIELLVAMLLLSLVSVALAAGVHTGVQALTRVEGRTDTVHRVRSAQAFLRSRLETAEPLVWRHGGTFGAAFEGKASAVAFVSTLPPDMGPPGRHLVRVAADQDSLVVSWEPVLDETAGFAFLEPQHRVLVSGVRDVQFGYLGSRDGVEPVAWHDTWEGAYDLPRLVRVQLTPADPRLIWPPLIVAPALDQEAR